MISPPDSEEHDAPEHLRITLHGGKSFTVIDCANNKKEGRPITADKEVEICRLRREGWKVCSIARKLMIGDKRVSRVLAQNGFQLRRERGGQEDDD